MNQRDDRSELQKRIAAELTEKAKKKREMELERPDGVDDSAYIQGSKTTSSLAWVWILLIVMIIVAAIWYIVASGNQY